jgi:hypothetical protein
MRTGARGAIMYGWGTGAGGGVRGRRLEHTLRGSRGTYHVALAERDCR